MSVGRPVPIHASGGGVVKDCIICGLPYAIHDHAKDNWLGCPDASVDRSPEGEKPQALNAKHESAVGSEASETPDTNSHSEAPDNG